MNERRKERAKCVRGINGHNNNNRRERGERRVAIVRERGTLRGERRSKRRRVNAQMENVNMYLLFLLLLIVYQIRDSIQLGDVFCGHLLVFKQQIFATVELISAQKTVDLRQCLHICCGIPNCQAVLFTGVIRESMEQINCRLLHCSDANCSISTGALLDQDLLSVRIVRPPLEALDDHLQTIVPSPPETSAPLWAVLAAILVAVVCVGLNIGLISAYIIYRRQRLSKQSVNVTTVVPFPRISEPLQAFSPVD